MKIHILEVTEVPSMIIEFCRGYQVNPDFYGKVNDLYFIHGVDEDDGRCFIQFFGIEEDALWVRHEKSGSFSPLFHEVSDFVHREVGLS